LQGPCNICWRNLCPPKIWGKTYTSRELKKDLEPSHAFPHTMWGSFFRKVPDKRNDKDYGVEENDGRATVPHTMDGRRVI